MQVSRACRRALAAPLGWLHRLRSEEKGSELVQFVLVVPLLAALMWSSFEAWQMMTLKSSVRSTAAQAARYVTAFVGTPEEVAQRPSSLQIRDGVEQLVAASFSRQRGVLGDALNWRLTWFRIIDPTNPRFEGNVIELDPGDPLAQVVCNDQFAIRLDVDVPWRTVLFGYKEVERSDYILHLSDTAVGASPCAPYCSVNAYIASFSSSVSGCRAELCWSFQCSYEPDRLEVMDGTTRIFQTFAPMSDQCTMVSVPPTTTTQLMIRAYGGRRTVEDYVTITCP